jgi:hypothetical protein
MNKINQLISNAYDLHVHVGPELIPRKYTVGKLVAAERGKIAGMALKNHFFSTLPFIAEQPKSGENLIGGLVLNNFVGGLNPDAIYAAQTLAKTRFIVWFPTVSAQQFLKNSRWEVAPEWVGNTNVPCRSAKTIKGISVLTETGNLSEEARSCLVAIKKADAILATGHISWQESLVLVKEAARMGITRIIATHCIYQKIAAPIEVQKKLISYGAKIEHCFSMYTIDEIPIEKIVSEIKAVGTINCIMSSDVGQTFNPSPSEALKQFAVLLMAEGISSDDLETMLVTNPTKLVL